MGTGGGTNHQILLELDGKIGDGFKSMNQALRQMTDTLVIVNKSLEKQATPIKKTAENTKKLNEGFREFRGNLLTVMFFGMGMSKMFGQWNNAALETLGITQYFNQTMQLMTIEALVPMTDAIFGVIDSINNLDPATKQTIGTMMLMGQILGNVLFFFGSIMLAAAGLGGVFGPVISKFLDPLLKMLGVGEGGGAALSALGAGAGGFIKGLGGVLIDVDAFLKKDKTVQFLAKMMNGWAEKLSDVLTTTPIKGINMTIGQMLLAGIGIGLIINNVDKMHGKDLVSDIINIAQVAFGAAFLAASVIGVGTGAALFGIAAAIFLYVIFDPLFNKIMKDKMKETQDLITANPINLLLVPKLVTDIPKAYIAEKMGIDQSKMSPAMQKANMFPNIFDVLGDFANLLTGRGVIGHGDFLMRPGQPAVAFSPNDTIVGSKGGGINGGFIMNLTINANTASGVGANDIARAVEQRVGDEFRRLGLR